MATFNVLKKIDQRNYNDYSNSGLDGRPLEIGAFNELVDRLNPLFDLLIPVTHLVFTGKITLARLLTHYDNWIANSNAEVFVDGTSVIGGSAEIRMIGDNVHTPLFSAFTKSSGSADFDPTTSAINKIVFYYDGTEIFYSITIL